MISPTQRLILPPAVPLIIAEPPTTGPPDMEKVQSGKEIILRPRGWNPRRTFFFCWDVTGLTVASATETTSIGIGGVTVASVFIDNEMGVVNLLTGSGLGSPHGGVINAPNTCDFDTNTEIWIRFRSRETANRRVFVGITDTFTEVPAGDATHHAGFVLDDVGSGNFRRRTSDGTGPATEADYTPVVAVDTAWHTVRIRRTATQVGFTLDNNAEELVTATLPGAGVQMWIAIGVLTTNDVDAKNLDLSYWSAWRTGMSR